MEVIGSENIRDVDVRDTLNADGGHVNNNQWTHFSTLADIDEWSRYKPIRDKRLFISLEEWRDSAYKGTNGQCGFDIPVYKSPASLMAGLESGSAMWTYLPPDGKVYPFRTGDWRMYNPNAVNPVGDIADYAYLNEEPTGYFFDVNVDVVISPLESTYNLCLDDIEVMGIKLSDMYLGVYLKKNNGGYIFRTGNTPIGSEGLSTTIQGYSGSAGNYMAYLFLSEKPQLNEQQDCYMVSINKAGIPFKLKVYKPSYIEAVGYWDKSSGVVNNITLNLHNNRTQQFEFRNISVNLVKVATGNNPATGSQMTPIRVNGSYMVGAESDYMVYVDGSYQNIYPQDGYEYWLVAYADNCEAYYMPVDEDPNIMPE